MMTTTSTRWYQRGAPRRVGPPNVVSTVNHDWAEIMKWMAFHIYQLAMVGEACQRPLPSSILLVKWIYFLLLLSIIIYCNLLSLKLIWCIRIFATGRAPNRFDSIMGISIIGDDWYICIV